MIDFLSGAVAASYLIVAVFFLRFWRTTQDRLFILFALAFLLFAINQIGAAFLDVSDERTGYAYVLRVLGYLVILFAIVDKNTDSSRKSK